MHSYSLLLQSFFFLEFTIKRYKLELWPIESSGFRTSNCEMYIQYIKLLEKPDIFFTQLILVVHRINCYRFTKIVTVQTQIILLPSSTPCLFRGKLVYLNGKHTILHRNLLIWCQLKYAILNTRQPYPLIDSDAEMWSDTPLKTMKIAEYWRLTIIVCVTEKAEINCV